MLDHKGDTALYIQYAYVRMLGILKNNKNHDILELEKDDCPFKLSHSTEIKLIIHLMSFWKMIERIMTTLEILPLTNYLRELSVRFTQFIHHCRVIGSGEYEKSRLKVVQLSSKQMLIGMDLMALDLVDKL